MINSIVVTVKTTFEGLGYELDCLGNGEQQGDRTYIENNFDDINRLHREYLIDLAANPSYFRMYLTDRQIKRERKRKKKDREIK